MAGETTIIAAILMAGLIVVIMQLFQTILAWNRNAKLNRIEGKIEAQTLNALESEVGTVPKVKETKADKKKKAEEEQKAKEIAELEAKVAALKNE